MKRLLWMALLVGTVIAATGSTLAQRGPRHEGIGAGEAGGPGIGFGRGPERPRGALFRALARLDLSQEQRTQLRTLGDQWRETLRGLGDQTRGLNQDLRTQFDSGSPDANEVGTLVIALRDLRDQRREAGESFRESALGVLTEEQRVQLEEMKEQRHRRPGMRGGRRGFGRGAGGR